MKSYC